MEWLSEIEAWMGHGGPLRDLSTLLDHYESEVNLALCFAGQGEKEREQHILITQWNLI